jgi:hypothetical protein
MKHERQENPSAALFSPFGSQTDDCPSPVLSLDGSVAFLPLL